MRIREFARGIVALTIICFLGACAPNDPAETAASPVQAGTRSTERVGSGAQSMNSYDRRGDDGTIVGKVLAPAPQVWDALKATFEARNVHMTVLDRAAGRMGDTAMVFSRRWNNQPGSFYFQCGQVITGQRADEDRIKAVVLAQLTRLKADTIGIAVHMSAFATSVSMSSSTSTGQCISTGRGEIAFLDEVMQRLGTRR